jgi:anti-sigma factor RsiW
MAHDRMVAGLRCSEVLAELSEYVDRQLPRSRVEQIEAHLRGCDWCEQFGGQFSTAIASLRTHLTAIRPVSDPIRARLRQRLQAETETRRDEG